MPFQQQAQKIEGLAIQPDAHAILAQFARRKVEFEHPKAQNPGLILTHHDEAIDYNNRARRIIVSSKLRSINGLPDHIHVAWILPAPRPTMAALLQRGFKMTVRSRLAIAGIVALGGLTAAAQAEDINVFLNAASSVSSPPSTNSQAFNFDQTTGLNTPTLYSVSAANGGGSSVENTTVSMGTLHSYSYSSFPLNGTSSYSQGYVNLFTDDRTIVPAGVTSLTDSFALTGSTSPIPPGGDYAIEAVVYDNLIDLDNGDSSTNIARAFFDLQNPGADVPVSFLTVKPGDRIEESVEFEISTYQDANAGQPFALIDYSETLNLYVDTNVPGADMVDASGHDYSSTIGATPEPETSVLMGIAAILVALALRTRTRSAVRGQ